MKLHLPKRLLTALLAAFTAISLSTGSAAWGTAETIEASVTWTNDEDDENHKYEAGEYLTVQGNGTTLTIDGETVTGDAILSLRNYGNVIINDNSDVTISRLVTHDSNSGGTSESVTLNGGVLNITDSDTGSGNFWTAVLIGHWSHSPSTSLNVNGGQLNVLNGTVQLGFSSAGHMVVTGGTANIKKLNVNSGALTLSGGRLNIGSGGLVGGANQTATLTGGTLGVLDAGGWSLGNVATTIGTITIDTNVWDAATNTSTTTGSNINLLGNIQAAAGGMNITLDGSGSLTIDHTLNGVVTLAEGSTARLIADISNLSANYTKVYSGHGSTGASGFWLGSQVMGAESTVTAYDTQGNQLNLVNGVYNVAADGIFYVNDEVTYDASTMAQASQFSIGNAGVLSMDLSTGQGELVLPKSVSSTGTLNLAAGAMAVNLSSLFSADNNINGGCVLTQNADAVVSITTTGAVSAGSVDLSSPGTIQINNAASFTNNSKKLSGGKLVLSGVTSATISGGITLSTNLELINTSLTLGSGDVVDYNNTGNLLIKVGAGSSITLGTNRQSLRSNHVIEMAGGRISGTGNTSANCLLGLDFFSGGRINVTADSTIATNVGGHINGTVVFDVSEGVTLTMEGALQSNGIYEKTNTGTMLYQGGAFTRNLKVSGGVFEYNHADNRTYSGTLSGSGTFKKSGSGTLLLSAANSSIGTLNASGGITQISGTLTVNSVTAGNGQVVVLEDGVLSFTNISGTENLKNILALTGDKLVTKGDSYLLLAPTINNTTGGDVSMTADMVQRSNVVVNGRLDLHGRSWDSNHANGHVLTIDDASFLKIGTNGTDELRLVGRAKVNVTNGSSLYAGKVVLGYDSVPNQGTSSYGALTISSGSATLQEIEYRLNTGNSFEMTGGHVEFTGANIITRANDNSVGSFAISGGKLLVNTDQALTQSGNISVSLGNVDLQIAANKTLTLGGTLNITGTMTHNGEGTLAFAGSTSLVLTSDNLSALQTEGIGVDADTNGLGKVKYNVVTGTGTTSYGSNITLSIDGSSEGYSFVDGSIISSSSVYIINTTKHTSDTDADFVGASAYHVNAGGVFTLQANIPGGKTVKNILTTTTGAGKLSVTAGNIAVASGTSVFQGDVWVESGCNLTLGGEESNKIDFSSLNSMVLNGGTLKWQANGSRLKKLDVRDNSHMAIIDTPKNSPVTIDTVSVAEGKTFVLNKDNAGFNYWNYDLAIGILTGAGAAELNGSATNEGDISSLVITSLKGFTGNISIKSREAGEKNKYNATVNTGADGANFGNLTFNGYGEQGEKSTATFNVQGDTTIGTLSAAGATVNILEGKTLTLGANVHTIGTLTMEADSQIVANFNEASKSLTVDKLNIEANSSVSIGTFSSSNTHKGLFHINALTGTNSSLILKNGSQESDNTIFNLGSVQGSAFTGNIYIQADNQTSTSKRSVALNIMDATVAQGAVIHFLGKNGLSDSNIGLGIECDTEIAGISSGGSLNGTSYPSPVTSTIVAGAIAANNQNHISNASSPISLTINVAEGADYTTSATIKDKLNLIKKGVGSQTFSGDVSAFNGSIDVQGGMLAFTGAAGWTTGISATVASGAELSLGNGTSNSTYNITALSSSGTVSLAANAILTLGNGVDASTHNIGTLNAGTGSKLNLAENAVLNAITSVTGSIALTGSGLYKLPTGAKTLTENVILDSNWTGTVAVQGVTSGGNNKNPIATLLENLSNGTQSKVQLSNVQGWLSGASTNRHILLKNTDTSAALTLNDGSTYGGGVKTSEFAGSIGGSGDIVFNWSADSSNTTQRHLFSGDTSTWSGKFINQDCNTMTMMVEFSKSGNVFNSTVDGGGILNKNAQTTNSNKSGGKMLVKFNSSDTIDFYGTIGKEQGASGVDVEIAQHSVNFHKAIEVDSITVANNASATVISTLSTNSVQLGDTATITNAEVETATSMENVKLSEEGISSADETGDTKGTVSDAKVTLAALAEGTSFSIEDVTLSNVNIEAANAEDRVNLSGVNVSKGDASTVQLTKGEFHMMDQAQAQVGTGGTDINLPEGGPVNLNFTTSLMEGMTLGTDASLVVDLGDLSGFDGMSSGKPTFSITLAGFSIEGFNIGDFLSENPGIYFAADSWLGQLLVAQGASDYVKGDSLEAGAQATTGTGTGSGVSVSYNSTNVGTVIIISGLQVPEPASATLGLAALMMLCARRRRRA